MSIHRLERAICALLTAALAFQGAGCVGLRATASPGRPPADAAAVAGEPTGSVELDLKGVRYRGGERPEGVEVRLRRIATRQDMFLLTEADGPTRVDRLPPGRYELRVDARRLGAPAPVRRTFDLKAGQTVLVQLHDGRRAWTKAGKAIGEGALVVGKVLLVTAVVAGGIVLWAWLESTDDDDDCDSNGNRKHGRRHG